MDFLAQLNNRINRQRSSEQELARTLGTSVKCLAATGTLVVRRKCDEALVTRIDRKGIEREVR